VAIWSGQRQPRTGRVRCPELVPARSSRRIGGSSTAKVIDELPPSRVAAAGAQAPSVVHELLDAGAGRSRELLGRGGQCAPMPMPRDGRGVALRSTATPRFSLRARPARSRPVHLAAATGGSAPPVVTGRQRRTLPDFQRASMCRHSRSSAVTYRSDWSLIPPPRGRGDGCFGDSPCTGGNLKSIDQGVL